MVESLLSYALHGCRGDRDAGRALFSSCRAGVVMTRRSC
jgi:hypothetical protein